MKDSRAHAAVGGRIPPRAGTIAVAAILMLVLSLAFAGAAQATAALSWSAAATADAGGRPTAISCPSEALCVVVDESGRVLTSTSPLAANPVWSLAAVDPDPLSAVACASQVLCVAVDRDGGAFVSTNPATGPWTREPIDGTNELTGVSCPSMSLCVAVDSSGTRLASSDPAAPGASWLESPSGEALRALACGSEALCVAVDGAGEAIASGDPGALAPIWEATRVDTSANLTSISCPAAGYCVAVDASGRALASIDPLAATPTWSATTIDRPSPLAAISCSGGGLCVAVDEAGRALASDDPTSPLPAWSTSEAGLSGLVGVACLPAGACVAIDAAGKAVSGRVPPPEATTTAVTSATATTATLAGVVNAEDAVLQSCWFEYGLGASYGRIVPCEGTPSPTGGAQFVSAQLVGLIPNTTYHYRVLAGSAIATGAGGDATFTTATSTQIALVHPQPSISGTPAVGQRLTCHPGTPASATIALRYAWLRDLIPIPGEASSAYTVKGQDSGHHLQCQVTATDGGGSATATSAFVTVPVQGVLASVGETAVGTARGGTGKVLVPVTCSTQSPQGCRVTVRVTVVETLAGGRVVAVAAARRGGRASGARRRSVTIALVRVRIARGAKAVVTAPLAAGGRRLLSSRRSIPAEVVVSGTVIGAIEATLSRQLVRIGRTAGHGSRRATRP